MGIKTFTNPSKTNNELFLITAICYFIGHYRVEYAIVDIFLLCLLILWRPSILWFHFVHHDEVTCHFFSIQEVILELTFALNFINCSKFPSLFFPRKARPWWERNCISGSIVKIFACFWLFHKLVFHQSFHRHNKLL